ncbi:hypothetical protein FPV67DRAFT_924861 [Lyophyllum atratum]|nr:hypothetical protein FPV67DRAFT_924861 [Lyophyllum atratum]
MKIDHFTRLVPPQPAQVNIDPTPKDCPSDGFNYPTFRLLNKQERVKLSTKRFDADPSTFYNHLAVANSKGWFAAITVQDDGSYALICSPLADLRTSFKNAKDSEGTYTPKRKVALQSQKPSILAFATNDTRLFMSFEHGGLLVYDTAALFTEGSDAIAPLHMLPPDTGPIRHIVPNPGTEPNLVDLVAVVHSNRTVVLYNSSLETQGGWIAGDMDVNYTPAAVAWSPKGKHIAIGLQGGHIMTYPLTNKSSIHKHVPPTALPPLISLEWLSPGHTFRTSYAPSYGTTDPIQHIICVDTKAPTATYYAPTYPFPLPERGHQSYTVVLPKWDEDAGAAEPKSLVVVGDKASIDLEILGSIGTQWYQQSQENPLSLPLDSNMEDTVLLGLQADLTDVETMTPIMYAYLNDGTVQGWYMEHTKPYPGMINPQSAAAPTPTEAASAFIQPAAPAAVTAGPGTTPPAQQTAFGQPAFGQASSPSAFGQASGPSAFGQSSFGQPSAFGKPSAFGQQQTTSTFGTSAFGQPQTSPTFGQAAPAGGTSAFGQPSSASAFGGGAPTSAFGQPQPTAAFGQPATTSAFGGGGAPSAFGGGTTTGAFGSGAFGGGGTSTNAFRGGAFASTQPTSNAFGGNAFGGLAATGGNKNAFGQASFGFGAPAPSSPPPPAPAPDMSREASMSDATPSFGGMGLGEPNDPSKPAKSGGIFGSAQPTAPSTTTTSSFGGGPIRPATGFGAFSAFSSSQTSPATSTTTEQKPPSAQPSTSTFGTSSKPASAFGQSAFGTSGFGQSAFGQSTFGKPAVPPATTTTGAIGGGFGAFASSPVTSLSGAAAAQQPGNAGSAFRTALESPPKSTSPPTGGFGAFASSPSAFGTATTQEPPKQPTSATDGGFGAFGRAAPQQPTTTSPFAPSAPQATSPFAPGGGTGPGFGVSPFGPQPGVRARSPFETPKPAALMGSPPSSPEATPRLGRTAITSDESPPALSPFQPSTTPVTSPFGNVAAPGAGAFGNIQTSPSVFRPASGFGAFGGDKTPASSPFFKAPTEPKTPSVSAFANALTTPPSAKAPAAAGPPMFGSSSSLGGARAAFVPAAPAPTPTKVPAVGGFGAFSGTSAGFGSFAGPKKSFGELLKTGDGDTTDPVKPKTGAVVEVRKEEEKQVVSAFPAISKYVPVSVFTPPQKEAEEKKKEPSTPRGSYSFLFYSLVCSSFFFFFSYPRRERQRGGEG